MRTLGLILRIALRQTLRRRGLSLIATLGVALGVVSLVGMTAIMRGFQGRYKEQLVGVLPHVLIEEERVGQQADPFAAIIPGPLAVHVSHRPPNERPAHIIGPHRLIGVIARVPEVRAACGLLLGNLDITVGSRHYDLAVRGIDPEPQDRCTPLRRFIRDGRWSDFVAAADSLLIGRRLAEDLKLRVGDLVRVRVSDGGVASLRVAAIFETGLFNLDRQVSYIHRTRARSLLALPDLVNRIDVRLHEPFSADRLASRLRHLTGHKTVSWIERAAADLAVFRLQNIIVSIQIAAMLIVGGFGILAVQIMMVLQKTQDISILRSIGLRRIDILAIFVAQGALIAFAGALAGDLGAWRLIAYLDSLIDKTRPYSETALYVYDDPTVYVLGAVFAVTVGALASLLPAWRGARIEPVDVLRGRVG